MQNNEKNKMIWRVAKGCSTFLFALFSFFYLYYMQSDLLACFQYILSDGLTSYSPIVGGVIITSLLVLCGEALIYLLGMPMSFLALSYFPSALFLVLITCGNPAGGSIDLSVTHWGWILFFVFLFSIAYCLIKNNVSFFIKDKYNLSDMWPNMLILSVLFVFIGGVGNTNNQLHQQLKSERLLRDGCYSQLAEQKCFGQLTSTSSAIRALALSHEGLLGEKLFYAPQGGQVSDLLVNENSFLLCDSLEYEFYTFWGARPGMHVSKDPELFFKMILDRNLCDSLQRTNIADFYLCSILLRRDLDRFATEIQQYYPINDSLPKHYQEALILYKRKRISPVCVFDNRTLEEDYNDFLTEMRKKQSYEIRINRLRRTFGNTYWYYYYTGKKA